MHGRLDNFDIAIAEDISSNRRVTDSVYRTNLGAMFCGFSENILNTKKFSKYQNKVQLILTSPPFPLNTKKKYGNLQGEEYINWFADFAPLLRKFLKPDGSIVVEIGNAWEPGKPVMSTVVLRALLRFLEKGGFHLCQEFIFYNPARLPTPVQWVNIERIRVKDTFTRLWWMSPNDRPKADNRKVLKEYSDSMIRLLKSKKYNSGKRPSQHQIGEKSFLKDNKGAIPPNVIISTNTRSSDRYQQFCRQRGIPLHPARMPPQLAEFFIKFLTDKSDLVLDPFAGSNTTGEVAGKLKRKWISIEADWQYSSSSIARFAQEKVKSTCPDIHLAI